MRSRRIRRNAARLHFWKPQQLSQRH